MVLLDNKFVCVGCRVVSGGQITLSLRQDLMQVKPDTPLPPDVRSTKPRRAKKGKKLRAGLGVDQAAD